jgi:hypothetical protein
VKEPQWTYKYIWYTRLSFYTHILAMRRSLQGFFVNKTEAFSPPKQTSKPTHPFPLSKPSDYWFCNPKPGRFLKKSPKKSNNRTQKVLPFYFSETTIIIIIIIILKYQIPAPHTWSLTLHYK